MEKPKRLVVILKGVAAVLFCIPMIRLIMGVPGENKIIAAVFCGFSVGWFVRFVADLKRYLSKEEKG